MKWDTFDLRFYFKQTAKFRIGENAYHQGTRNLWWNCLQKRPRTALLSIHLVHCLRLLHSWFIQGITFKIKPLTSNSLVKYSLDILTNLDCFGLDQKTLLSVAYLTRNSIKVNTLEVIQFSILARREIVEWLVLLYLFWSTEVKPFCTDFWMHLSICNLNYPFLNTPGQEAGEFAVGAL